MINAVIKIDLPSLVLSSPNVKIVKAFINESTADSIFIARKKILEEEAKVYLSCDKGHNDTDGHFVKYTMIFKRLSKSKIVYLIHCQF